MGRVRIIFSPSVHIASLIEIIMWFLKLKSIQLLLITFSTFGYQYIVQTRRNLWLNLRRPRILRHRPYRVNFRGREINYAAQPVKNQQLHRAEVVAGCQSADGFKPGGSTWSLPGCRRGVCAVSLDGTWVEQVDSCE